MTKSDRRIELYTQTDKNEQQGVLHGDDRPIMHELVSHRNN